MLRPLLVTVLCWLPLAWSGQASTAAEVDWPGWRGPKRDGWVRGFRPPAQWPDKLQRVWQVEVGSGYASPVVGGGRVFQHARQGEQEVVRSIELETGDVQWRKSYAAPFKIGGGAAFHGKGPKSSPALADGRLFTLSIGGVLSAWDADTGDLLWRRDYRERFGGGHPYWGAATSPLVDGNRVVVHFGGEDRGALIALDVETGEEVWTHGSDAPSYASPILVDYDGSRQVIELTMRGLVSVESGTGRPLWEYPYPQVGTDQNMVTPAFHKGLVLLGGENRGIRGLQLRRADGAWKVHERWHQKEVALDMSSAVVNGELLYGFSHYDSGRLFCLDIRAGEVRWQGPPKTGDNVAFLAISGHVVALVDNGRLLVIAARGDRFEQVASYEVSDSPTWAPPVLLPGGVLVKDGQTLTRWSFGRSGARSPAPSR